MDGFSFLLQIFVSQNAPAFQNPHEFSCKCLPLMMTTLHKVAEPQFSVSESLLG